MSLNTDSLPVIRDVPGATQVAGEMGACDCGWGYCGGCGFICDTSLNFGLYVTNFLLSVGCRCLNVRYFKVFFRWLV